MKNKGIATILVEMLDDTTSSLKISERKWNGLRKAADSFRLDRWEVFKAIQETLCNEDACNYIAANYSTKEICWEYCAKCNDESPIVDGACKVCGTKWVDNQEAVG